MGRIVTILASFLFKRKQAVVQATDLARDVAANINVVNTDIGEVKILASGLASSGEKLRATGNELTDVVVRFDQQ